MAACNRGPPSLPAVHPFNPSASSLPPNPTRPGRQPRAEAAAGGPRVPPCAVPVPPAVGAQHGRRPGPRQHGLPRRCGGALGPSQLCALLRRVCARACGSDLWRAAGRPVLAPGGVAPPPTGTLLGMLCCKPRSASPRPSLPPSGFLSHAPRRPGQTGWVRPAVVGGVRRLWRRPRPRVLLRAAQPAGSRVHLCRRARQVRPTGGPAAQHAAELHACAAELPHPPTRPPTPLPPLHDPGAAASWGSTGTRTESSWPRITRLTTWRQQQTS